MNGDSSLINKVLSLAVIGVIISIGFLQLRKHHIKSNQEFIKQDIITIILPDALKYYMTSKNLGGGGQSLFGFKLNGQYFNYLDIDDKYENKNGKYELKITSDTTIRVIGTKKCLMYPIEVIAIINIIIDIDNNPITWEKCTADSI